MDKINDTNQSYEIDINDMTSWTPEQWKLYLDNTEGDIDKEIGIAISQSVSKVNSILNLNELFDYISEIESKNDIRINIEDDKSITIYDIHNGNVVGEIKPGNYSYNGLEKGNHMFHVVNEPYKGKGLGKLLLEVYGKLEDFNYKNFKLPIEEYTHTASMLNLLSSFGYYVSGKYIDGELVELSDTELFELFKSVDSREFEDDNLGYTYKLKLNK